MWREKKLFPNLDFYASLVYHQCNLPTHFFTPIFVIARSSGWFVFVFKFLLPGLLTPLNKEKTIN
jgi:2-methylcitrate synthase